MKDLDVHLDVQLRSYKPLQVDNYPGLKIKQGQITPLLHTLSRPIQTKEENRLRSLEKHQSYRSKCYKN